MQLQLNDVVQEVLNLCILNLLLLSRGDIMWMVRWEVMKVWWWRVLQLVLVMDDIFLLKMVDDDDIGDVVRRYKNIDSKE